MLTDVADRFVVCHCRQDSCLVARMDWCCFIAGITGIACIAGIACITGITCVASMG